MRDFKTPTIAEIRRVAHLSRFNPDRQEVVYGLIRLEMIADENNDARGKEAVRRAWHVFHREEARAWQAREEAANA